MTTKTKNDMFVSCVFISVARLKRSGGTNKDISTLKDFRKEGTSCEKSHEKNF